MINYKSDIDETFILHDPELTSYLYFPLANEKGVMSSITPSLSGDSKISQNAFLMPPVSMDNLHNDKSSRNFWCRIDDSFWWSATGKSSLQQANLFTDKKEKTVLEAGFMHHKITRKSDFGLEAEITSFVPSAGEKVEVTGILLRNLSEKSMSIQMVSACPIYARSADSIRDHRHVTSLLNRIRTTDHGIMVDPTMTFDERGHRVNTQIYGAFGGMENERPSGFIPTVEAFIGEGGSLENPRALHDLDSHLYTAHETVNGYEALGGIAFSEKTLMPGEHVFYSFVLGYGENAEDLEKTALHFLNQKYFNQSLEETKKYWRDKLSVTYGTGDSNFNNWMRWVSFQPFLRRIYGCSFLPHHDYGKGGRGWRDLWQDCLALLIMDPKDVRKMLVDNYGGVRLDGTNATIIGYGPGEFIADRNNITRVWMDHGMWPLLTTNLYIQQTGDIEILLEETTYFHDMQICRGEKKDLKWDEKNQNRLMDKNGEAYYGTILEHILIEHLTAFYDVGALGHMRLRGADWNDALDMASEKGESVAFTSMYAHNMDELSKLLVQLKKLGTKDVKIHEHLLMLLDDAEERSPSEKQELLEAYCMEEFSGRKVTITVDALIENLKNKSLDLKKNIRENEWISNAEGFSWYNGYYDNQGKRVEGEADGGTRIMLTSQVFTVMSETADEKELKEIIRSADQYLYDPSVGGYRLNTDFKEVKMDLGRMFGFAYGHKENGAVFSHMAVMYGYALYSRGKSEEAHKVISSLYRHSMSFEKSRIYPGIPEYFDPEGRGMYHYLTGSASWLLLTVVTQMFGVRGKLGSLLFAPKLTKDQFDADGKAEIILPFHGRVFNITYLNPELKAAEAYTIKSVTLNQKPYSFDPSDPVIKMEDILELASDKKHSVVIELN